MLGRRGARPWVPWLRFATSPVWFQEVTMASRLKWSEVPGFIGFLGRRLTGPHNHRWVWLQAQALVSRRCTFVGQPV